MDERESAVTLANKILERVNADPDDDLAVLSRQLLRRTENIATLTALLERIEGIASDMGGKTPAQRCALIAEQARALLATIKSEGAK